jgi:predicted nucleotide-binding protein
MSNKFYGSIDELKSAVGQAGFVGNWEEKAGTAVSHQFQGRTGEVLNWWPSSGTLSFQGKNSGSFQSAVMPLLQGAQPTLVCPATNQNGKRIFIVHGHDTTARDQLELILMRLGLQPFILQNSDAGSKTIVEALEVNIYKESALGIILMTPDDYGYSKTQTEADRQPRARQNVILEMGMVMASLGRERMLILKKGALELPSDAAGILYHEFNDHVKEIVPKLVQRLQQLGFEIDTTKIAAASA